MDGSRLIGLSRMTWDVPEEGTPIHVDLPMQQIRLMRMRCRDEKRMEAEG